MSDTLRVLFNSQQGGTLIDASNPNRDIIGHLYDFISHADKVSLLGNKSLYGSNYKITIPQSGSYKSPFYSSEMATIGKPVNTILMKCVLLSDIKEHQYWVDGMEKYTMVRREFIEEIKTQQTIYTQSAMLGSPVTVAVLGAIEGSADDIEKHILKGGEESDWSDLLNMMRIGRSRGYSVGIICMEFLESYMTIYQYTHDKTGNNMRFARDRFESAIGMVGYSYLRMFSLGFVHFDVHTNNVMIDLTTTDYFNDFEGKPTQGRVVFIDFGRVQRVEKGAAWNPMFSRKYNQRSLKNLISSTEDMLSRFELTGQYIYDFFILFMHLDVGQNSVFNLFVNLNNDDYRPLVELTLTAVDMRQLRIQSDHKNGLFAASTDIDTREKVELLNLQRINKLATPRKYDFMSTIHCYEGEMCMKLPVQLDKFTGIDADLILLCHTIIQKDKMKDCMKYIVPLYKQSIAPISVRNVLMGHQKPRADISSINKENKKAPKKRPSAKKSLKPCREGQIRNPETNRCISADRLGKQQKVSKKPSGKPRSLKPCKETQIRNPETNRCVSKTSRIGKKIAHE